MTRRPAGWLEGELRSGRLHRAAAGCKTARELAEKIGLTLDAYESVVKKVRAAGRDFPTVVQMQSGFRSDVAVSGRDMDAVAVSGDFDDEERTQPGTPLEVDHVEPIVTGGQRYYVKGRSTLRDASGNVVMEWEKTAIDQEQHLQQMIAAVSVLAEPYKALAEPAAIPTVVDADLMAMYMMGDPHLGLMTWAPEVGVNHDLDIGERDMMTAVEHLVDVAPKADLGVVCMLGDNLHFDNESVTTTAGTRQDADTRWTKVMRTAIRAGQYAIDLGLEKHGRMLGKIIRGNHDRHSSAMLALCLANYYSRDPRVEIDLTPDPFSYLRFGKVLIMATHSDECSKADDLAAVMACDRPQDWGETLYRYILCGHLHHRRVQEARGAEVEVFPTLAPRDRWHHGKGYRAQQTMCVDTYDRNWGRVNRTTIGIRQVRSIQGAD